MKKYKVFLSYAKEDAHIARKIYRSIVSDKIDIWFDEESLEGGDYWLNKIQETIRTCDFFLLILSNNSTKKRGTIQREVKFALNTIEELNENERYIIPIRIEQCDPSYKMLSKIQWIDMFPDWDKGLKKIKKALSIDSPNEVSPFMKYPEANDEFFTKYPKEKNVLLVHGYPKVEENWTKMEVLRQIFFDVTKDFSFNLLPLDQFVWKEKYTLNRHVRNTVSRCKYGIVIYDMELDQEIYNTSWIHGYMSSVYESVYILVEKSCDSKIDIIDGEFRYFFQHSNLDYIKGSFQKWLGDVL